MFAHKAWCKNGTNIAPGSYSGTDKLPRDVPHSQPKLCSTWDHYPVHDTVNDEQGQIARCKKKETRVAMEIYYIRNETKISSTPLYATVKGEERQVQKNL